ncbi:MAG TPA: GH32 C-terminal domain-containing protein [Methylomirabilota bacterium]|nr:GH32 C-terminal domain-containing protein [Methylomirabilota bacterium]
MSKISHVLCIGAALLMGGVAAAAELYEEKWRPHFHFTPATNWMNDPNGMVYFDGEYHLFYQYNPFGDKWGHMSWGHAVSPDMVNWKHLPVALYEENDIMIFSGSAVVDWKNTSGFGKEGKPPLVAIYTGHYTKKPLQNQHIAYSNDRGRTWTKYAGNPVLDIGDKDFRDPKVMWHEATKHWVMTVAWPTHRKVRFYSSPNLKEWTHLSDFGPAGSTEGIWECPDLFPLRVEGGRGEKWVLIVNVGSGAPAGGSGCQYFVGDFDGTKFTLDSSYPKPTTDVVPAGKVLAAFEGENYEGWEATGDAFGSGPARGTLPNQQNVSGFQGNGLVNSYRNGDNSQGTLTSPVFTLSDDYLNFLIGGGRHPGKTGMSLLVDGKEVRTATGADAERLARRSWDVREFRGKQAQLRIFDQHTGGWGHINVDQIMLANAPARGASQPALWADYAPDFYAAVSWSDIPNRDGRRLWLGWMSNWQYANEVPTSPWRSAMSIPRELVLRRTGDGLRLFQEPVKELEKLRVERKRLGKSSFAEANEWLRKQQRGSELWEMEMEVEHRGAAFELQIPGAGDEPMILRHDPSGTLTLTRPRAGAAGFHGAFPGRYEAPVRSTAGKAQLRLFLDTSSVEIFANNGEVVMTAVRLPEQQGKPVQFSAGTSAIVRELTLRRLKASVPIHSDVEKTP